MADNQSISQQTKDGFINSMLDSMPSVAKGFVGSLLGTALAVVLIVQFAGLQAPMLKIADAYADNIKKAADKVDNATGQVSIATDEIRAVSSELRRVVTRLEALERQTAITETAVKDVNKRIDRIENHLGFRFRP